MANICPACNKDMTGRSKFTTGCCGQTCCGDCLREVDVLANHPDYCGAYGTWDGRCSKGATCDEIAWVCDIIQQHADYMEQCRLERIDYERRAREREEARARETPEQRAQREAQEQAKMEKDVANAKAECEARGEKYWDWSLLTGPPSSLTIEEIYSK